MGREIWGEGDGYVSDKLWEVGWRGGGRDGERKGDDKGQGGEEGGRSGEEEGRGSEAKREGKAPPPQIHPFLGKGGTTTDTLLRSLISCFINLLVAANK